MNQNELKVSWDGLLELLATADCTRQQFPHSSAACVMNTSVAHLMERGVFFKKKHTFTKQSTIVVRLGVIDKEMKAHALALYKAWEGLYALSTEYRAIAVVQQDKARLRAEREEDNKQRIDDMEDAATRARNRAIKKLQRTTARNEVIDLGGQAEDDADALEDAEEEAKQQRQEAKQKEEDKRATLRAHILTSFTIEEADKLLSVCNQLSAKECDLFLQNYKAKKREQPPSQQTQPKSILNSLLDKDSYDEPTISKTIIRKKNKSSESESESDGVSLPDSPKKAQRVDELATSMTSFHLGSAATGA